MATPTIRITGRPKSRPAAAGLAGLLLLALLLGACAGGAGAPAPASQVDIQSATQTAAARAGIGAPGGASAQTVSFNGEGGVTLSGTLYGAGDTVALLANMQATPQSSWQTFARKVAEAGYAAFTFDYRGLGASGGSRDDTAVAQDVRAAIGYLRGRGFTAIVLIGASLGGVGAAKNSKEANVAGLGLISTPRTFQTLEITSDDVTGVSYPKLFIASEDDSPFEADVRAIHSWASPQKDIKLFTGDAHGTNLFDTEHKAEFEDLLLGLIKKAAGDA